MYTKDKIYIVYIIYVYISEYIYFKERSPDLLQEQETFLSLAQWGNRGRILFALEKRNGPH